ncbi:recombinase RecT [Streptomyces atroolivaceus]|uniref:recombinase RecT n=1 Tax=Streptomyces atroolivaceus TaxID=66869 RepID=UPI003654C159
MSLSTLRARVIAATTEQPAVDATVQTLTEDTKGSIPAQLHASAQAEGDEAADMALSWLERYGDDFEKALPSHIDVKAFLSAVRAALPGLVYCTPASLRQALLTCARFGLVPDGYHAVIVAEGRTAAFIPMAQGYIKLMMNTGEVGTVRRGMIYENDDWNYEPTAPSPLDFTHKPNLLGDRGKPILAYAFCWMKSGERSQVELISQAEAEAIRDEHSQLYRRAEDNGKKDSFWHTHFEQMWAKSPVLRLHKTVGVSAEVIALRRVEAAGDAGEVQIIHAPAEEIHLQAEADEAHERAEESQDPQDARTRPLPRKGVARKRSQPKRTSRRTRKGIRR